ncbi:winged helix-turn-helix domain-containing protein [Virgibacillus sp. MSJ-26]|uniref:ArsR/SmtB family transcription factor n=1 Tax=Virgibacillus sp. MSJ-26 TaxID=2841522 RepID=UPI001C0FA48F|nr:winged helix-turn-helix domain-containing protein [Virgibacillus sp. MSJ-26]MBU5466949.1 winged helix-turn-helix domain-containing protein [Virgibacillus sp. MSJ-26]
MKEMKTLTDYSQLKAISDPIRAEILMRLIERPLTGKMLSDKIKMSRANIHYHLKELEKNHLIELVRKEEKGGVIQKFYQSVARGFTPSADLLPYLSDVSESARQMLIQMNESTKSAILSAPEKSFEWQTASEDPSDWNFVGSIWQLELTEEDFQKWIKKYFTLMDELREISRKTKNNPDANYYLVSTMAFEIDELMMEENIKKEEK